MTALHQGASRARFTTLAKEGLGRMCQVCPEHENDSGSKDIGDDSGRKMNFLSRAFDEKLPISTI